MGKGSSPRNCFSKEFKKNFDDILWLDKSEYCYNCGRVFKKEQKRILHADKSAECIQCNFN